MEKKGIKEDVAAARELLAAQPETAAWLAMMDIGRTLNLSAISRQYFGKSANWLLQRLRGYNVNGKPATLKPEEFRQLADALDDIAAQLRTSANNLRTFAPTGDTPESE